MIKAFLLINVETGREDEVLEELKKTEGVIEAFQVYGPHDVILKIEIEDEQKLAEVVSNQIKRIDTVRSIATSIIVEN